METLEGVWGVEAWGLSVVCLGRLLYPSVASMSHAKDCGCQLLHRIASYRNVFASLVTHLECSRTFSVSRSESCRGGFTQHDYMVVTHVCHSRFVGDKVSV